MNLWCPLHGGVQPDLQYYDARLGLYNTQMTYTDRACAWEQRVLFVKVGILNEQTIKAQFSHFLVLISSL